MNGASSGGAVSICFGYVTFIDPAGNCNRTARLANVLRAIDVFGRLNIVDLHSSVVRNASPPLPGTQEPARLLISRRGSVYEGAKGMLAISRLVPLLWPLAPLSLVLSQPKQSFRVAKATK